MQASWKGALPLFGILERKRGKGIDCDVTRIHPLPDLDFRPAWEFAEHQGRPSNGDKGPRSDKAITEIKAGCDDN